MILCVMARCLCLKRKLFSITDISIIISIDIFVDLFLFYIQLTVYLKEGKTKDIKARDISNDFPT